MPKAQIFRFGNFWLEHGQFNEVFQNSWNLPSHKTNPAQIISAKLKRSRKVLKDWQNNLPRLAKTIDNTKLVIQFIGFHGHSQTTLEQAVRVAKNLLETERNSQMGD
jgi:hypothetical protein